MTRPTRRIEQVPGAGWRVSHSGPEPFTTQDRGLAERVRQELDQVDPLPCPHENGFYEITTLESDIPLQTRCMDCGAPKEDA